MQVGSLVIATNNFTGVRKTWGLNYPYKNDILTISFIKEYAKGDMVGSKHVLLYFIELDLPCGLCSKNFREIQPPMDLTNLIKETDLIKIHEILYQTA